MLKNEFINELRARLSGLPEKEVEDRLAFYSEMIDDRIEEGLSEDEAVSAVGSVENIASEITSDIPLAKIIKKRTKRERRLSGLEIALIIIGFPIWLPILAAIFVALISLYACLWSVIVSLWAVFASFVGSSFGGIVGGIILICCGNTLTGISLLGAGIFLMGLSIFTFFGCRAATKGAAKLTKLIALLIKRCFIKKEAAR